MRTGFLGAFFDESPHDDLAFFSGDAGAEAAPAMTKGLGWPGLAAAAPLLPPPPPPPPGVAASPPPPPPPPPPLGPSPIDPLGPSRDEPRARPSRVGVTRGPAAPAAPAPPGHPAAPGFDLRT